MNTYKSKEPNYTVEVYHKDPNPGQIPFFEVKMWNAFKTSDKCKECGKTIYWGKTQKDKRMPIEKIDNDDGTYICVSHFDYCPKRQLFKKGKKGL